ncbi:MAG: transcriptional repressor [Bacteroidales bacterium]|nr:transcriptional repressor [Bacteroidales bacterium]
MKANFPTGQFISRLKAKGLKATPQRLSVHQAMTELGHASADMVCEWISSHSDTRVTVASIYNILSQLTALGFYRHRLSANNKMFFDVSTGPHMHLYDIADNEYRDIVDDELAELVESHLKRKRFRGYKVEYIDIQIVCHPTRKHKKQQDKQ